MDRKHGKRPLGSSMYLTLIPGELTIDVSSINAYFLGLVNGMQYEGLARENNYELPFKTVELTNCFASTYALIEDFHVLGCNIATFSSVPGTIKIFDVLVMDPVHIFMDMTVEWQMCNAAGALD